MSTFAYRRGSLFAEGVSVEELADRYGTPLFVYSQGHLKQQFKALTAAMRPVRPLICYSVKVNTNAAVIRTFADLGAGADVVSGGELFRALRAGIPADRIAFAGVGKTADEIAYALREGILFFTVESVPELERISTIAERLRRTARVAIRVNPDVDPDTHHHVATGKKETKFGLHLDAARRACRLAARRPGLELVGLHMHIGSQILSPAPYAEAIGKVTALCAELKASTPSFRFIDIGGGLGIQYRPGQQPLDPSAFARRLLPSLRRLGLSVVLEPGRFLVGNCGILVATVQYVKPTDEKTFLIVDAGMNDLIRPPLYGAHHDILPVEKTRGTIRGDVVGPICESADYLAKDRVLPAARTADLLAVMSAGAYGFSMSSNYNSRPRAAEIMVSGRKHALVRARETREDLVRGESMPRW